MNEVKITYETLFDLLRREKSKEELQELDPTFYADVILYLQGKFSLLKGQGSQSGLFGASESEKVKIQVVNIKKLIKELYERRLTKILRFAFNKSKTGSGLMNTTAMLPEEKTFFEQALVMFTKDRAKVLNPILSLDISSKGVPVKPVEQKQSEPVSTPKPQVQSDETTNETTSTESEVSKEPKQAPVEESAPEKSEDPYDNKVKIRFKSSIPKFVGKKMESYGPYQEGDIAEVPELIAKILVNKEKAERL